LLRRVNTRQSTSIAHIHGVERQQRRWQASAAPPSPGRRTPSRAQGQRSLAIASTGQDSRDRNWIAAGAGSDAACRASSFVQSGQSTVAVRPPPAAQGCAAAAVPLDVLSDANCPSRTWLTRQPLASHRGWPAAASCFCNQCVQQRHPAAPTRQPGREGPSSTPQVSEQQQPVHPSSCDRAGAWWWLIANRGPLAGVIEQRPPTR